MRCLEGLVEYDFWLRLVEWGLAVRTVAHPLVARELDDRASADVSKTTSDGLRFFGAVLDRYADPLDRELAAAAHWPRGADSGDSVRFIASCSPSAIGISQSSIASAPRQLIIVAYLEHHGRDAIDWGDFRRTDPISRELGLRPGHAD